MINYNNYSRFNKTPAIVFDNQETFGAWEKYSWLKERPADKYITTMLVSNQYEGRPDLLSNIIYGTPLLDWVLLSFNAIHNNDKEARNILNWPKSGQVIIYPQDIIVFPEVVR